MNTDKLTEQLGITTALLLDFLVCFSRFEYALKKAVSGISRGVWMKPIGITSWTHVEQIAEDKLTAVIAAGGTLLQHPPKNWS